MDVEGGILAGIVTALAALAAIFRSREDRAKRQVEMAAQLQQAMVDRVQRLETWSQEQDKRIDQLQEQLATARTENAELKWKYADLWEDHTKLSRRCDDLEGHVRELVRTLSGRVVALRKGPKYDPG